MNKFFSFTLLLLFLFLSNQASAACTSPAGGESQTRYDFTAHKLYYCNNTDWIESGGSGGGGSGYTIVSQATINSSQTYNIPGAALSTDWVVVGLVAGGGSGSTDANGSGVVSAGAGAGGGYAEFMAKVSELPASLKFVIGAGGGAVSANDANGVTGGDSYIGDLSGLGSVMDPDVTAWVTGGQGGKKLTSGISSYGGRLILLKNPWRPLVKPVGKDSKGMFNRTGANAVIETGTSGAAIASEGIGYTGAGGSDRSGGNARPRVHILGTSGLIPDSVGGARGNNSTAGGTGTIGSGGGASYCWTCGSVADSGAGGNGQAKVWIIRGNYHAGDIYSIP